jgi:hypothetical protein
MAATTWRYIREYRTPHNHLCVNLKSYINLVTTRPEDGNNKRECFSRHCSLNLCRKKIIPLEYCCDFYIKLSFQNFQVHSTHIQLNREFKISLKGYNVSKQFRTFICGSGRWRSEITFSVEISTGIPLLLIVQPIYKKNNFSVSYRGPNRQHPKIF